MALHDTNTMADLDEVLGGPEPDYDLEPDVPDDGNIDVALDQANKWLYHYARLSREADEIRARAEAERARITEWETHRLSIVERQQGWFTRGLHSLHAAVLPRAPKRKTIQLPNGVLKATKQQPEWTYDEAVFLAWAKDARPELVNQPAPPPPPAPKVAKNEAKAVLEIPDGAAIGVPVAPIDPTTKKPVPGALVEVRGNKHSIDLPKEDQP